MDNALLSVWIHWSTWLSEVSVQTEAKCSPDCGTPQCSQTMEASTARTPTRSGGAPGPGRRGSRCCCPRDRQGRLTYSHSDYHTCVQNTIIQISIQDRGKIEIDNFQLKPWIVKNTFQIMWNLTHGFVFRYSWVICKVQFIHFF